jgi:hypothetical protein
MDSYGGICHHHATLKVGKRKALFSGFRTGIFDQPREIQGHLPNSLISFRLISERRVVGKCFVYQFFLHKDKPRGLVTVLEYTSPVFGGYFWGAHSAGRNEGVVEFPSAPSYPILPLLLVFDSGFLPNSGFPRNAVETTGSRYPTTIEVPELQEHLILLTKSSPLQIGHTVTTTVPMQAHGMYILFVCLGIGTGRLRNVWQFGHFTDLIINHNSLVIY